MNQHVCHPRFQTILSRLSAGVILLAVGIGYGESRAATLVSDGEKRDGAGRSAGGNAWFTFDPKPDAFADSPIDLRFLNEKRRIRNQSKNVHHLAILVK